MEERSNVDYFSIIIINERYLLSNRADSLPFIEYHTNDTHPIRFAAFVDLRLVKGNILI